MQWKDISSFSQSDKERIPDTWEARPHRDLRIVVCRGHIRHRGKWVLHCRPWLECHELPNAFDDIEGAQAEALARVRGIVSGIAASIAA